MILSTIYNKLQKSSCDCNLILVEIILSFPKRIKSEIHNDLKKHIKTMKGLNAIPLRIQTPDPLGATIRMKDVSVLLPTWKVIWHVNLKL